MTRIDSRIYLASRSPRRRELLHRIGVQFDLLLFRSAPREDVEVSEALLPGEAPEAYVVRVACAKATHGARLLSERQLVPQPLLSADTTLDFDGEIIGKPGDENEATRILTRLSGRSHRVLTAVAMTHGTHLEHVLSVSTVHFRDLGKDEIHRYVLSGEPLDKAGAYAIQGYAAIFVTEIHGSHSGIVGLPLCETAQLLRRFGCLV
ncbi:MAG TPA: Maf family protein [Rhodocyclaceae bacterium]|nr:Maf family protein [Rhodocyclaceae bacterium]